MSNQWFRWYLGTCEDGKFRMVARNARVTVSNVIALWALLLEDAAHELHRGISVRGEDFFASILDLEDGVCASIIAAMAKADMLTIGTDGIAINNWNKRQYETDAKDSTNAERQRRHREKRKSNVDVTESNGCVTAMKRPEAETEADTEKKAEQQSVTAARPKDDLDEMAGARQVVALLDASIAKHFGEAQCRLAPNASDIVIAQRLLDAGATVEACSGVIDVIVQRRQASGGTPPRSLKYFEQAIIDALANKSAATPDLSPVTEKPLRLAPEIVTRLKGHPATAAAIRQWFDPCDFDVPNGVIYAHSAFAADKITEKFGSALTACFGKDMLIVKRHQQAMEVHA